MIPGHRRETIIVVIAPQPKSGVPHFSQKGPRSLLADMQNYLDVDGQKPTPNISSILVATNSSFSRDKLGCTPTQNDWFIAISVCARSPDTR